MGLTIHYNLHSITDGARRRPASWSPGCAAGHSTCPSSGLTTSLKFPARKCSYEQYDRDHPHRRPSIQSGLFVDDPKEEALQLQRLRPTHIIAFSTWPGQGCEEANFGLVPLSGLHRG